VLPFLVVGSLTSVAGVSAQSAEARQASYQRFLGFAALVRGGTVTPNWMADGSSFWYLEGGPDSAVAIRVDPRSNTVTPLLDVARVRRAVARGLGHEPPYRGLPFPSFSFEPGERAIRFSVEGRPFRLALDSDEIGPVAQPSPAERARLTPQLIRSGRYGGDPDIRELPSPDGRWMAGDRDHQITLRSTVDGRVEPLTSDGAAGAPWSVATNSEWSETPHTAKWSPDGLRLAAMRANYDGVARLPLVHWLKPVEEVEWRPYVKAGGAIPRTELVVIDVLSKRKVAIDSGAAGAHYVIPIGWTDDGSALLYYRMRRDYKVLEVFAANPTTGGSRLLVRETQPTFIKGISSTPGWTELFHPVGDGKRFVWLSERDGWDHLYLYRLDGTLIRRLTTGAFPVLRVIEIDQAGGWVYFTGHAESRLYDTHLYRVRLDGTGFGRLTEGPGEHAATLSPSKSFIIDTHSSLDRPPTTELRSADGRLIRVLARASIDSLRALGWRAPEEAWVKAADGATDLRAVIITPAGFDSTKRYPVIDNIYGGPQLVYGPRAFLSQGFNQALAQLGFVVISIDARGTIERGKAFQDVVYRQFGTNEIPDHVAATKALAAARPFMDLDRVGIFGGSWGGYMTIRAMVLAPEFYRVGVSIYPVGDLYDHWNLIESYMDLPNANPAGYQQASSYRLADRVRGNLLLIHGTSDVNATFSATMKMVDALTRAGKPYDLVVFPDETHSMTPPAVAYRTAAMTRYLIKHLKP
jgi:dipeptidyl aminopeptidase/acylaminoacyl peptidase